MRDERGVRVVCGVVGVRREGELSTLQGRGWCGWSQFHQYESFILNSTRPLSSFLSSFLSSSSLTHPVASHFKALLQVLKSILVLREGEVRVGDVVKDTRLLGRVSHLPQDIQTLQVPEEGRMKREEEGRKKTEGRKTKV